MSVQNGLYFPYFHFPGDDWVKLAALYWDRMYRIVPQGYPTKRDTPAVTELSAGKSPFIKQVKPEQYYFDLEEIKFAFMKLIEDHSAELVKAYGIENRHAWADDRYTLKYSPSGNPKLAYILIEKIEHELKELLLKRGLGTTRTDVGSEYQWVGMHPRLANVYMAALAEKLAAHANSHPVAQDTANYFAVSGFTFERLAQVLLDKTQFVAQQMTADEIEAHLAVIAFRAVIPKNLEKVKVEDILSLRERFGSELGRFQELIRLTVAELPGLTAVNGPEFVQDNLESVYAKKVQPLMDDLEDTLHSRGFDTMPAILNVTVFAGAGGLAGGAFSQDPVVGAAAGIGLALLNIFAKKREEFKTEIGESDVAYLLRIQDEVTPKGFLDRLEIKSRKILFGS